MRGFVIIFLLLLNLGIFSIQAQKEWVSLKFNHLTTKNGLSNSEINCITQDRYGYIWIGTRDGLNRYDGYNFQVYRHNSNHPNILIDNFITTLHCDKKGRLWAGTLRGISIYNEKSDNFINFMFDSLGINNNISNRINAMVDIDNNDVLVITEEGKMYRFNTNNLTYEKIKIPEFGIVKSMIRDKEGNLFIGTMNGLYKYNFRNGIIWHKSKEKNTLPSSKITSICLNNNELWVGTEDKGIVIIDLIKDKFTYLQSVVVAHNFVQWIERDKSGNIWAGSYAGLRLFKNGNTQSIDYYHVNEDQLSLAGSGITCVFSDVQNNIWIGLGHMGVDYIINNKKFDHYRFEPLSPYGLANDNTSVVFSDNKGRLWVGSHNGGLGIIEKNKSGILRINSFEKYGLNLSAVQCIYQDQKGTVWIGTYNGGLSYWDEKKSIFHSYVANPDNLNALPCNDIRSIAEDTIGNYWLVTHGYGITKFDKARNKFTNIRRNYSNPDSSILDDWCFYIKRTSDGNLWIGGTSGITVFNPYNLTFKYYQYNPKNPNSITQGFVNYIYEDSKKQIWVATDYGFCKFDTKNNSFIRYSENIGIPKARICGILEDMDHFYWISSDNGLIKFNPTKGYLKFFDENDGLQSNEFSPGACSKSTNGEMFFGGRAGVTGFYPRNIVDNDYIPPVLITGLKLFNESVLYPLKNSVNIEAIKNDFLLNRKITLSYKQNIFSIEFVAFNYINPMKNKYAYILEGFDQKWDTVINKREVTYTNLNPGNYTFWVKACNSDGYWNQTGDKLIITIVPPYWKTLWFQILSWFTFGLLIFLFVYLRIQRIKSTKILLERTVAERTHELQNANEEILQQRNELALHRDHLEEIVQIRTNELEKAKLKAEESDRLKSSFLSNMSHEIRTPMNAITGFIYLLRDESLDTSLRFKYLNIISRNSDVLLRLIDDILDFSKIEAGELKVSFQPVSLIGLLDELNTSYTSIIKERSATSMRNVVFKVNNKLNLSNINENPNLVISSDKMRLNQILTNLIENAIKFTENGVIEVGIENQLKIDDTGQYIEVYVEDSGIGIPEEELPFIFDRFRKVESDLSKIYRGVGLGLAISKRLAYLLGGTLSVKSYSGKGSRFSLLLPFNEHFEFSSGQNKVEKNQLPIFEKQQMNTINILIAEDDESNYKLLETILKKEGYLIHWAQNGEIAVNMAINENYDIVLMDIKLPILNGMVAMKKIKEIKPNIPVIAQTAYAMSNEKAEMFKAGFDGYISKPISYDLLIETIREFVNK